MDKSKIEAMRQHLKSGGTQVVSSPMLYPTPSSLADEMASDFKLNANSKILEPSAGSGNLIRALLDNGADINQITACEIDSKLSYTLSNQYPALNVLHDDFLNFKKIEYFSRIIMNPPFDKQQDIVHVLHALKMLKPKGGLIAIMSEGTFFRKNKLTVSFWDQLKEFYFYDDHKLPEGTFKNCGTMVNTRMIKIIK